MERRNFIRAIGATASLGAIAGCTGEANTDSGSSTDNGSNSSSGESEPAGELEIVEHGFYRESYGGGVEGVIVNNTGETLSYVEVEVVFLNEEGQRLGSNLSNTQDLPDGQEWVFEIMFFDDFYKVEDYEITLTDTAF